MTRVPGKKSQPQSPTQPEPAQARSNTDNCFKALAGVQEQIRFADTKAAFLFAINTLMFGFVANNLNSLREALAMDAVPVAAWVALGAVLLFGMLAVSVVGILIYSVMSRLGEKAPRCRIFFGHIACNYGNDFEKYVRELRQMDDDEWCTEAATQIVETSHIAYAKHRAVKRAAQLSIGGLVCWTVSVFCIALLPTA